MNEALDLYVLTCAGLQEFILTSPVGVYLEDIRREDNKSLQLYMYTVYDQHFIKCMLW